MLEEQKETKEAIEAFLKKIRDNDFSEFCGQLGDTRLLRDAASFCLGELVHEYNAILKSLSDSHLQVKTKTITLCPSALWHTEELRSQKKKNVELLSGAGVLQNENVNFILDLRNK